jgi:hypothetical protein
MIRSRCTGGAATRKDGFAPQSGRKASQHRELAAAAAVIPLERFFRLNLGPLAQT